MTNRTSNEQDANKLTEQKEDSGGIFIPKYLIDYLKEKKSKLTECCGAYDSESGCCPFPYETDPNTGHQH